MNKTLKTSLAVVLATASLATLSAPAQARDWNGGGYGGGHYGGYRGDGAGAAIAGGVIGLALGAAIASSNHNDYGYRSNVYGYAPSYGGQYDESDYAYPQRQCVVRRQVWDGYDGRYEVRRVTVPC